MEMHNAVVKERTKQLTIEYLECEKQKLLNVNTRLAEIDNKLKKIKGN